MCLDTLIHHEPKNQDKIRKGWKVFTKRSNGQYGSMFFSQWLQLKKGKWYRSDSKVQNTMSGLPELYLTGWHIFPRREDAIAYRNLYNCLHGLEVVEVEYKSIVAIGPQLVAARASSKPEFGVCVCAGWMRIKE